MHSCNLSQTHGNSLVHNQNFFGKSLRGFVATEQPSFFRLAKELQTGANAP